MKGVFTFLLIALFTSNIRAYQSDNQVVATIDDHPISAGELLYAYQKNRDATLPIVYDSLNEYLEQYINFKLKVLEAKVRGLDTLDTFQAELDGYISQIRKPYLNNEKEEERLISETYSRKLEEVNASHLLIKVAADASPQDTLKAYQFLDSLRSTINSKEEFEQLAKRYSQDGSARSGGKLGWFSAMDMVYPFEIGAYGTAPNAVSEIIKSRFGYHLIYVNEKRSSRGSLKTAHIFFSFQLQSDEQAKILADKVYDSLKAGGNWDALARTYSNDRGTKMNGGQLPWARIKQLPDDFYDIAYSLSEVGDISAPSKTQFGWHIVRLDGVKPIPSLEDSRDQLAQQLKRSGRNVMQTPQLIAKLKRENGFIQDSDRANELFKAVADPSQAMDQALLNQVLFTIGTREIKLDAFLNFVPSKSMLNDLEALKTFYKDFESQEVIAYEDDVAPTKYPEYGYLLREYEEGMLLFEIMQNEVWNRALEDSVGTSEFYKKNHDKYKVGLRLNGEAITSTNSDLIDKIKAAVSRDDRNTSLDSLAKTMFLPDQFDALKIVKRSIKAAQMASFDATKHGVGSWVFLEEHAEHLFIKKVIPSGHYDLEEIRGIVISDYQDHLDKQWIESLRSARKIKVFKKALKSLAN